MTKDEALKLALDALEVCEQSNYGRNWVWPDTAHPTAMKNVREAITTIKEALAQPEQEPDYYGLTADHLWMSISKDHYDRLKPEYRMACYTTPPQRKPLTAMEVYDVVHDADLDWHTGFALGEDENRFVVFARAIEAAHGIKGEA